MNILLKAVGLGLIALAVAAPGQTKHRHKGGIPITVTVDSQVVTFTDNQPMTIKGTIMVPLRGIFEKIGAYVEYDAANHMVIAHRANESVELRLGDKIAKKNGTEIIMEIPACIVGGSTMVPLRFVAQSLGAKVAYDQPTNTVSVLTHDLAFGPGAGGGTSGH